MSSRSVKFDESMIDVWATVWFSLVACLLLANMSVELSVTSYYTQTHEQREKKEKIVLLDYDLVRKKRVESLLTCRRWRKFRPWHHPLSVVIGNSLSISLRALLESWENKERDVAPSSLMYVCIYMYIRTYIYVRKYTEYTHDTHTYLTCRACAKYRVSMIVCYRLTCSPDK